MNQGRAAEALSPSVSHGGRWLRGREMRWTKQMNVARFGMIVFYASVALQMAWFNTWQKQGV